MAPSIAGFPLLLAVLPAGLFGGCFIAVPGVCGRCRLPGVPGHNGMGRGSPRHEDEDGAELPQPVPPAPSCCLSALGPASLRGAWSHARPRTAAPRAHPAAAVPSHPNPETLLERCPSILGRQLVASGW